jgi:hypothetical protein
MAINIKAKGKTETPAPKPRRSTAAKSTAKRGAAAKRATKTAAAAPKATRTPRATNSKIDARTEAKFLGLVEKAGKRRAAAEIEHKESVTALHAAAAAALEAGVPMAKVSEKSGISRQWLYKMGEFANRSVDLRAGSNGNGVSKPVAKTTTRKTTTARKASTAATPKRTVRKRQSAEKPASKGTARPRIRTR